MSERESKHVTIARSGPGNPRNDSASVVELEDRRLMVVWHKYEGGADGGHDLDTCRIYARTSSDGGMSWNHERMLVDVDAGDKNVQAPALALLPSGELLMICLRAHKEDSTTMCLFRSEDNGDSFHEASRIWQRSKGQWLQGGANCIMILASGRLLVPCHGGEGGQFKQHNITWCFLSDDDGHTWRRSQTSVDLPMRGAMEPSVAELEGGRLCMSLRTQLGSVFLSYSDDGGETWSLAQCSGLKSPESGTCLRRIPGTNNLLLVWNDGIYDPGHHHYGRRTPLSLAVSQDEGKSWKRIGDIDSGEYELTTPGCTLLKNGNAIVTYMRVENPEYDRFRRAGVDLCAVIVSDP